MTGRRILAFVLDETFVVCVLTDCHLTCLGVALARSTAFMVYPEVYHVVMMPGT